MKNEVTVTLDIDRLNKLVKESFEVEDLLRRAKWSRIALCKQEEITDFLAALVPSWKQRYAR